MDKIFNWHGPFQLNNYTNIDLLKKRRNNADLLNGFTKVINNSLESETKPIRLYSYRIEQERERERERIHSSNSILKREGNNLKEFSKRFLIYHRTNTICKIMEFHCTRSSGISALTIWFCWVSFWYFQRFSRIWPIVSRRWANMWRSVSSMSHETKFAQHRNTFPRERCTLRYL